MGYTQLLTEMSTGNIKLIIFVGSKVRRVRGADNFTAICELLSNYMGSLTSPRPITGIALLRGLENREYGREDPLR
jgi:hypothetical protein